MNQIPSWTPEAANLHTHTAPAKKKKKRKRRRRKEKGNLILAFHTNKLLNLLPSCSYSQALIFLGSLYDSSHPGLLCLGFLTPAWTLFRRMCKVCGPVYSCYSLPCGWRQGSLCHSQVCSWSSADSFYELAPVEAWSGLQLMVSFIKRQRNKLLFGLNHGIVAGGGGRVGFSRLYQHSCSLPSTRDQHHHVGSWRPWLGVGPIF